MGFHLSITLAVAVVVLAGLVRGFAGFGAAMVIMPGLSAVFRPAEALAILVLIELPVCLQLLPTALRKARWDRVLLLAGAATVGVPLGVRLLVRVDADLMRRAIAILVLLCVILLTSGWRFRRMPGPGAALGLGFASGLLGGSTGLSGPPIILFFLSSPLDPSRVRGSLIGFFALNEAVFLAVLGWHGMLTPTTWGRSAILAPFYLASMWFGSRLFDRYSRRLYRWAAILILVAVAGFAFLG